MTFNNFQSALEEHFAKKPIEEWKPIPSCPGYLASSYGNIRSVTRPIINRGRIYRKKGQAVAAQIDKESGYVFVRINPQGKGAKKTAQGYAKTKKFFVHRLVAETFLGECPDAHKDFDGTFQVDHINRVRTDNRPENLRYATRLENSENRVLNPTHGEAHKQSKINEIVVREIRAKARAGISNKRIFDELVEVYPELTYGIVCGVVSGKTWKHVS